PTTANLANIPQVLKQVDQWIHWRGADKVDPATGAVKLNKIPVNPSDGSNADSTDPRTWTSYDYMIQGLDTFLEDREQRDPAGYRGSSPGFVVTAQDQFTGVDFDDCVDEVTGQIDPQVQQYVDRLHSYTEVTPTTKGLRTWVLGTLPPHGRRK